MARRPAALGRSGAAGRLAWLLGDSAEVTDNRPTLLAQAPDASHYLLTPELLVAPRDPAAVGALLRASRQSGLHLTFRSGGTSLSGQGVTDGVLVDVRRHFRQVEVLDDGLRVRVQGGATLRSVNARLAPYGRKLGPDPASEIACTIGGVVSNNSSGMACGTQDNSYRTIESVVLVLPSGTVVDTGSSDADELLRTAEPVVYQGLLRLRDRVRADPASVRTIERLFAMKNTMGYGLNSFLDHDSPVDLLTHLAVGSEGTLAFIASATFRTVPLHPYALTGLLVFDNLAAATGALPELLTSGPATVELLDATSLLVAAQDQAAALLLPAPRPGLRPAALLVEYQQDSPFDGDQPVAFSTDPSTRAGLWHLRKGLYARVAAARPSGTSALLEDVAVPVGRLLDTCDALEALFAGHGYGDSVVFGHAKDGNLHFMLTDRFDGARLEAYQAFTEDLVDLVLGMGGSLKAEHGTGRTMAPFVRRQYGDELYAVMRELKELFDPAGILSPGVILDEDPDAHLRHLKTTPTVEVEVDSCVECGYCEPVCPSKDLTVTPRQRIAMRRALARARADGDALLVKEIVHAEAYDVVDTCAADGMCQTACPVLINTGDLVKRLRAESQPWVVKAAATVAAGHWSAVTRAAAAGLDLAAVLPPAVPATLTRVGGPQWSPDLPAGGRRRTPYGGGGVTLFPSCTGSIFGSTPGVSTALLALCARADVEVSVPAGIDGLCCGTPFSSKGLEAGHQAMLDRVAAAGLTGPVVCDASSCTEGLRGVLPDVVDVVDFALEVLLPQLTPRRIGSAVVHPTCSTTRAGRTPRLVELAAALADEVVVPVAWGCCAFAGDRGLLVPELTASATADEAAEIATRPYDAYLSDNRTCELGMARATGQRWQHVVELLDELTR